MYDRIINYNFTGATVRNSFRNSLGNELEKNQQMNDGRQQAKTKPPKAPKGARAVKLEAARQIVKSDFELAKMIAKIINQKTISQKTCDFSKSKVKTLDNGISIPILLEKDKPDGFEKKTENPEPSRAAAPAPAEPSGKKIKRVSPAEFEKIWKLKNAEKTANLEADGKIIEKAVESGTQSKHASISGVQNNNEIAFNNDFLNILNNTKNTPENVIKNIVNNDIELEAENETKEPVEFEKNKCFFTFDLPEYATIENVNSEVLECKKATEQAMKKQKDFLLKNNNRYERNDYEAGFRQFTQDEIDLLSFNHNFSLKKCRDIISKLKRLKNLIDTNHMFINLRKKENYYIEEIGKFSATEPTELATEPSDYIELNAYERALILYRAFCSVYMSKAEFVEEYKIFIPKSLLNSSIITEILNLNYYNSYIKQMLCMNAASTVFRLNGYFNDTKHVLNNFQEDIDILKQGYINNLGIIRYSISGMMHTKIFRRLYLQKAYKCPEVNEGLYNGYLTFDMMQVLINTGKCSKMYAKKIKEQFEENDINKNILEQCEKYLIK